MSSRAMDDLDAAMESDVPVPPIVEVAPGVRRFDSEAINAALDALPPDTPAVVFDVGADKDGVICAIAVRVNERLSVAGVLEQRYGDWSAQGRVRWTPGGGSQ